MRDDAGPVQVGLVGWEVTQESVREYLQAVGDTLPVYFQNRLAPPVALAAHAMGSLLKHLDLPPGAIHSVQEIETLRPVAFGESVSGSARLDSPKRRGALEFITAGIELTDGQGRPTLRGKTTVLTVDPDPPSRQAKEPEGGRVQPEPGLPSSTEKEALTEGALPSVVRTVTQDQINAYARVSGDHNPLHLDAGFAATTQFGGIIAHGMMTLAFISEMMALAFGRAWLQNGALKVRFRGAAYPGDQVEARGRVTGEKPLPKGRQVGCGVGLSNRSNGQELITGSATVVLENGQTIPA